MSVQVDFVRLSLQAMEAMAKTAFNNGDDEDTDGSGSDSYYSKNSFTDSNEFWDAFHYQWIIHKYNLLSALHDKDNDERESNEKLLKDLLDSDLDQNDSNNPELRNMEEYIHYTDSDSDSTYSDSDQDYADYNDGLPRKYTAEEFFSEFYIGDEENEEWKHFEKHTKDLFGDAPT